MPLCGGTNERGRATRLPFALTYARLRRPRSSQARRKWYEAFLSGTLRSSNRQLVLPPFYARTAAMCKPEYNPSFLHQLQTW